MRNPLLVAGLAISMAEAAIITVTRTHQGVCPATSSRVSWFTSTTTVSTSPSSPSPSPQGSSSTSPAPSASASAYVDDAIIAGAPFRINITPYGTGPGKRQLPSDRWVKVDGYLTPNANEAATFVLEDGQLFADGWLESTSYEIYREIFAAAPSDSVGPITRLFEVFNGQITWFSGTFENPEQNGEARFYYAPNFVPEHNPDHDPVKRQVSLGDALVVVFQGDPLPQWTQISLSGRLLADASASSVPPVPSSTAVQPSSRPEAGTPSPLTSIIIAPTVPWQSSTPIAENSSPSVQSSPPPAQSSSQSIQISSPSVQTSSRAPGVSSISMPLIASSSRSSTRPVVASSSAYWPISSAPPGGISTNGQCGPTYSGQTCSGSQFGNCCSRYGVCGSGPDFCNGGCQPSYGLCSAVSSSTALQSSSIRVPVGDASSSPAPVTSSVGPIPVSSESSPVSSSAVEVVTPVSSIPSIPPSPAQQGSSASSVPSRPSIAPWSSSLVYSPISSSVVVPPASSSVVVSPVSSSAIGGTSSLIWRTSSLSTGVVPPASSSAAQVSSSRSLPSSIAASSAPVSSSRPSSVIPLASSTVSSGVSGTAPCTNVATPLTCVGLASNGSFYGNARIECSMSYGAPDLADIGAIQGTIANTLEICIDRCRSFPQCAAGVYSSSPKNCYLKGSTGTKTSAGTSQWAFYFPYPEQSCSGSDSGPVSSIAVASSQGDISSSRIIPVSSSSPTAASSSLAAILSSPVAASSPASSSPSGIGSSRASSSSRLPQPSAGPLISKRGLVYVPSRNSAIKAIDDLIWIQPGPSLSWYYNYDYRATALYDSFPQLQFVPMLWGDYSNTLIDTVLGYLQEGRNITHVLGFNEPDGTFGEGGSQISPATAAARWISDIEPLRQYGIKLGAPAVTGSPRGFTWLQNWFTACNGRCTVDFMTGHYYGDFGQIASFIGQMNGTYPNVPIWFTEFADAHDNLASTQGNYNTTIQYFDRIPIERYSYFGAFRSDVSNVGVNATFLDQCGRLTNIGAWYMNWPAQARGFTPQSTACPRSYSPSATTSSVPRSSNVVAASSSSSSSSSAVVIASSSSPATSAASSSSFPAVPGFPSSSAVSSSSRAPAYTTTIQSTVFLSPSPAPPSSSSSARASSSPPAVSSSPAVVSSSARASSSSSSSSSTRSSSAAPAGPTCYRTDLHIGPVATGVPQISCITSQARTDDFFSYLALPFNVSIFSTVSRDFFVSTNGFITLDQGSSQLTHGPLPNDIFEDAVTGIAMPLWTDLSYDQKTTDTTSQGAYYVLTSQSISLEWVGHCNYDSDEDPCKVQFSLTYVSAAPGVWTFRYYDIYDNGASAAVGVQGPNYQRAAQFSLEQRRVPAGTQVVCDTNLGTCVGSTFT